MKKSRASSKEINAVAAAEAGVNAAFAALENARNLLNQVKGGESAPASTSKTSKGSKAPQASNDSKGSGGRQPSEAQTKVRGEVVAALKAGKFPFFTISELAEKLGADRVQTRNAVNYLETLGAVVRYAEKLPEGRGQRELIYIPGNPEALKTAA